MVFYENEETTGSAVSIKAKDVSNFENDGNTISFEGTLYEAKDGGNTYNFNYVSVYGYREYVTLDLILPETITCGSTSYSVTSIENIEYYNVINIESIKIPRSVTSIREGSFEDFSKLTNINVDEDNRNYASKDGVLFNKNLTLLIQGTLSKEANKYIIPSSVTSIGDSAFMNCSKLTSIEIPSSSGGDSLSGNSNGNGSSASSKYNTTTEVGVNTNIGEQKPKANGLNLIDGKWYYFDKSGAMLTGWIKYTDGKWYYLYSDGSMASNTVVDGYTLGADGALA